MNDNTKKPVKKQDLDKEWRENFKREVAEFEEEYRLMVELPYT